jgi:hypothetical protein
MDDACGTSAIRYIALALRSDGSAQEALLDIMCIISAGFEPDARHDRRTSSATMISRHRLCQEVRSARASSLADELAVVAVLGTAVDDNFRHVVAQLNAGMGRRAQTLDIT